MKSLHLFEAQISGELPQIYCDMDMVLVDFLRGANDQLKSEGYPISFDLAPKSDKDLKWELIMRKKDFWATLPPMNDAMKLWKFIKPHQPYILSTPSSRMAESKPGKRKWVRKHLGPVKEINLVPRWEKQKYAVDKDGNPNILIDDYIKNIREWRAKGGIGVHHTSALNTIKQLKQLGF
jgi:hypothetical protein